jgi:hypothetical protein
MASTLNIQALDSPAMVKGLRALPQHAERIAASVVAGITQWTGDEVADRAAAANHLPRKILYKAKGKGPRVFIRLPKKTASDPSGSVWIGAAPVKAEYFAGAVQTADGVRVQGHNLPGAFMAQMRSGHVGIFYAVSNPTRHSRGRPVTWQPNLPIKEAVIDIDISGPVRAVQALIPAELEAALQSEFAKLDADADG